MAEIIRKLGISEQTFANDVIHGGTGDDYLSGGTTGFNSIDAHTYTYFFPSKDLFVHSWNSSSHTPLSRVIVVADRPTAEGPTSAAKALPVNNALRNNTRESDIRKWFTAKELLISRYFRSRSHRKEPATNRRSRT